MSQHRSLRAASTLGGKRNVLKRFERVALLKKRGQWKDGDRVIGLPGTGGFADEIRRQQQAYEAGGGRFVHPVPEPRVLGAAAAEGHA